MLHSFIYRDKLKALTFSQVLTYHKLLSLLQLWKEQVLSADLLSCIKISSAVSSCVCICNSWKFCEDCCMFPKFCKDLSLSWGCLTFARNPSTQCITPLPSWLAYKTVWLYISFSNYSQTNLSCVLPALFFQLFSQMTSVLAKTVSLAASSPKQIQDSVTSCMQHAGLTMSRGLLGNRCEAWAPSHLPS